MTEAEALEIVNKCIDEVRFEAFSCHANIYAGFLPLQLKKRFIANLPKFNVWVIDSNGVRQMPTIEVK